MNQERVRDNAQLYLSMMQLGYRVDEISLGAINPSDLIAASNPFRVLLYLSSQSPISGSVGIRLPGGVIVRWFNEGDDNAILVFTQKHLLIPTFEWIGTDAVAAPVTGFEIVKK